MRYFKVFLYNDAAFLKQNTIRIIFIILPIYLIAILENKSIGFHNSFFIFLVSFLSGIYSNLSCSYEFDENMFDTIYYSCKNLSAFFISKFLFSSAIASLSLGLSYISNMLFSNKHFYPITFFDLFYILFTVISSVFLFIIINCNINNRVIRVNVNMLITIFHFSINSLIYSLTHFYFFLIYSILFIFVIYFIWNFTTSRKYTKLTLTDGG